MAKRAIVRNGICEFTVVVQANFTGDGPYTAIINLPRPAIAVGETVGIIDVALGAYNNRDEFYEPRLDSSPEDIVPYGMLSRQEDGGRFSIVNPVIGKIYIAHGIYICN